MDAAVQKWKVFLEVREEEVQVQGSDGGGCFEGEEGRGVEDSGQEENHAIGSGRRLHAGQVVKGNRCCRFAKQLFGEVSRRKL